MVGDWLIRFLAEPHHWLLNNDCQRSIIDDALEFSITSHDINDRWGAGNARSQIFFPKNMIFGERFELSFDVYIPEGLPIPENSEGLAIASIYNDPNDGMRYCSGPLTLYLLHDRWVWHVRGSEDRPPRPNPRPLGEYIQAASHGRWENWRVVYIPSFENDGYVAIYYGGQLVYEYTGITAYNDDSAPTVKLGIYTWQPFDGCLKARYKNIDIRYPGAS